MRFFSCFIAVMIGFVAPAAAQQMPFSRPAAQPVQPGYVAPAQGFPALPPSRACTAADMPGIWRLVRVYESPATVVMSDFLANPVQFILFDANSIYAKYNAGRNELPATAIRDQITQHASGLQQYLVDTSGFVFFYQDKQPVDTQACFIVVNASGPFAAGQMLMMPPQGQIQGRRVLAYVRVNEHPAVAAPPAQRRN